MRTRIKESLASSQLQYNHINYDMVHNYTPQMGDIGIFRALDANGQYLKMPNGSNQYLFEGDLLAAVFGNRYATNQFEGYVPEEPTQYCQLLGRGGVAGILKSTNKAFGKNPLNLELIGFPIDDQGKVVNTIQWDALNPYKPKELPSNVILSIGTSMDSGKTTTAGNLCAGLKRKGFRVAYIKLTGTAFPKDMQFVYDRGADFVCDFSLFGFPSTFQLETSTLLSLYCSLVTYTQSEASPDYIVIELADGLLQRETNALLRNPQFMNTIDGVALSCGDSLGLLTSMHLLEQYQVKPFLVSGLFTASALLIDEVTGMVEPPILSANDLVAGNWELPGQFALPSHKSDQLVMRIA